MTTPPTTPDAQAKTRYGTLQLVRILSLGTVLLGIAISRDVVPAPFWLGVLFAVGGLVGFFFGPPLMVRRWKEADRNGE